MLRGVAVPLAHRATRFSPRNDTQVSFLVASAPMHARGRYPLDGGSMTNVTKKGKVLYSRLKSMIPIAFAANDIIKNGMVFPFVAPINPAANSSGNGEAMIKPPISISTHVGT